MARNFVPIPTTASSQSRWRLSLNTLLIASLLFPSPIFAQLTGVFSHLIVRDVGVIATGPLGQEAYPLEPGKPVQREIEGGQSHTYRLTLAAGHYVYAVAEQRGIDLVVAAFAPDGQKLVEMDSPNGTHGPEPIRLLTTYAGEYRLEVRSPDKRATASRYEVRIEESRAATPQDEQRIAAQSAFAEGMHFFVQPMIGARRKAIEKFEAVLPLLRSVNDRRGEADTLHVLGFTYSVVAEKQKALEFYRLEVPLRQSLNDRRGEAEVLNNIGAVYNTLGESQQALDYYGRALLLLRAVGDHRLEAATLNNMGALYWLLGELGQAADYFNQAAPLLRVENDDKGQAVTLNNLGQISSLLGEHRQALNYYNRSLSISRAIGDKRSEAGTLHNIGLVYDALGETGKALGFFNQALPTLRAVGDRYNEAATLVTLGRVYHSLGDVQKALEQLQRALGLCQETGNRQAEAFTLYHIARVESGRGNFDQARERMAEALDVIESLRARIAGQQLRASFLATAQDYYEYSVDLLMQSHRRHPSEGHAAAALETNERAIARSLLESLGETRADIRGGVDAALIERERALNQQLSAKAELQTRLLTGALPQAQAAAVNKEIEAIITQYREVQAQIRASNPRYAALTEPAPLTVKEIQQQVLESGTLLLEYALGKERSYLWMVSPSSITSFELPKREEIEACVRRVYESFSTGGTLNDKDSQEAARALSQILLGPVAGQLGSKRLLIVATGALQYLPFAALPTPVEGRRESRTRETTIARVPRRPRALSLLIADHEIVNLPSASTLAVLRRELIGRPPAAGHVAVLADPVFDRNDPRVKTAAGEQAEVERNQARRGQLERAAGQSGLLSFERLRSTQREAEEILAATRKGGNLKALGFEASRATAVSERLGQYRVVHFATHGLLNSLHPELSGLVLSLVDERGQPQNGFLRAHEVYNLKLGADLVVLSGCQTALGKEVRGEGLLGLTRGFMYAGAPRVVASLWRVPDQATAELMKQFYRGMLLQGLTPAAALRAAQIAVRKEPRWAAPYYWAAFVLQGEWK
jgi:CHAT domain-containing protein/Tfp pilus assembly protein PilF